MIQIINVLTLTCLTLVSYGQTTIQTKEVKIRYTNGFKAFNICTSGCITAFDDNKEYFWYTEFSNIKSTKGGSGGNLLHGNYKYYDENGNLRQDLNYYLGLEDGYEKRWDSLGNIIWQEKWIKGESIYWKFQNKEKYWIEFDGKIAEEGTTRKVYTKYNSLILEETMLSNLRQHIKTFYENSGKINSDFTTIEHSKDNLVGKYTEYFENGIIRVDGQYYDGKYANLQVGTWRWFRSDGTLDATRIYKTEFEKWDNGEIRAAGGYIFDSKKNTWLKTGEWRWYTEEGEFQLIKKYKWGVEILE